MTTLWYSVLHSAFVCLYVQEEETLRSAELQLKNQELEEKLASAQVREVAHL